MAKTTVPSLDRGILSEEQRGQRERLIRMLAKAYWMEIETLMSYIANSTNPDGVRAQEVIEALADDVQEELNHAKEFATRIKELWGVVPGSLELKPEQSYLQPPERQTDIVHVIRGVIEAERSAIRLLQRDRRILRQDGSGDAGHGGQHPARGGGPSAAVRGIPARVRAGRSCLINP